jgi:ribosomal protein L37E
VAIQNQTQRSLLFGFIASIATCGLVGVYCLLLDRMGSFEERILITTFTTGAAFILGLALAAASSRGIGRWLAIPGALILASGLAMSVFSIWALDRWPDGLVRTNMSAWVLGVAFPHIGLLGLARLKKQYQWTQVLTMAVAAILAALIVLLIVVEPRGSVEDLWLRGIGIAAIAAVVGTIAVPILHRISIIRTKEGVRTTALEMAVTCPRCGRSQTLATGGSPCAGCGLKIRIDIEEEQCAKCGYVLYQLTSRQCPECGAPVFLSDSTAGPETTASN